MALTAVGCFVQQLLSFNARVGVRLLQPLQPLGVPVYFPPVRHRVVERLVDRALALPHNGRRGKTSIVPFAMATMMPSRTASISAIVFTIRPNAA